MKSNRVPEILELRVGCEVMLLKNISTEEGLVNGSRGRVLRFEYNKEHIEERYTKLPADGHPDNLRYFPVVQFCTYMGSSMKTIETVIKPESWDVNQGQKVLAKRTQIPLMLSWAMSIHKSQGMTIPLLEVSTNMSFEYGQVYVALSRAVSLENLVLTDFKRSAVKCHKEVRDFYHSMGIDSEAPELEEEACIRTSIGDLALSFKIALDEFEDPNDGWVENEKPYQVKSNLSNSKDQFKSQNNTAPRQSKPPLTSNANANGVSLMNDVISRGELSFEEYQSGFSPAKPAAAAAAPTAGIGSDHNPFDRFALQQDSDPTKTLVRNVSIPLPSNHEARVVSDPVPLLPRPHPPQLQKGPVSIVVTEEMKRRIEENRAAALAKLNARRSN